MTVGKVSDANFEAEVLKSTSPVVVDLWAEWCVPCRMIAPALEEIAGTMGDKVKIVKLNVDENPGVASKSESETLETPIADLVCRVYGRRAPLEMNRKLCTRPRSVKADHGVVRTASAASRSSAGISPRTGMSVHTKAARTGRSG